MVVSSRFELLTPTVSSPIGNQKPLYFSNFVHELIPSFIYVLTKNNHFLPNKRDEKVDGECPNFTKKRTKKWQENVKAQ
jgi:hypothetical protein